MFNWLKNLFLSTPTVQYCEKPIGGIIERPYYALSNIGFIFIGVIILFRNKDNKLSKYFGWTAILVGILSLIYDSTYSYLFQLLDVFGMLTFITLLLFLNISRIGVKFGSWIRWVLIVFSITLTFVFKGQSGNIIFGTLILLTLASEFYLWSITKADHRFWLAGFILFLLGFGFWTTDVSKIFCDPTNIFNGRGLFHVFGALSIYFFYKFYSNLKGNQL